MKTWHCKHNEMFIKPSYKDVKIQIYGLIIDVMSLVQMFQGKDNIVMIIIKRTSLEENEFMSIPTISRGYREGSFPQKDYGLEHNTHIIGL